jgi:hypothetical protein
MVSSGIPVPLLFAFSTLAATTLLTAQTAFAGGVGSSIAEMSKVRAVAAPWNASKWELVLLKDAVQAGAVCLDGSPGGYQIRQGKPGNKRWVVFHQGGGWCRSDEICAARASTSLGSSKYYRLGCGAQLSAQSARTQLKMRPLSPKHWQPLSHLPI